VHTNFEIGRRIVQEEQLANFPGAVWKIGTASAPSFPTHRSQDARQWGMCFPRAFVRQSQFKAAIARAAQRLAPDVVSIIPTLGDDWSGERAVFFMVILSDAASRPEQLLNVTNQVSNTIVNELEPLEEWGVLPYFNFRSQSEQAKLNEPTLA
jgi:hypothetical protein